MPVVEVEVTCHIWPGECGGGGGVGGGGEGDGSEGGEGGEEGGMLVAPQMVKPDVMIE